MCGAILAALISPRLLIAILFFFSEYLDRAYGRWIWPTLGFFFMPWTVLAYAWAMNAHGSVEGLYLVAVVAAVIVDVGAHGQGARHQRR
jgi:hypothetical protein